MSRVVLLWHPDRLYTVVPGADRYDIEDSFRRSFVAGLEETEVSPTARPAQVLSFGFKSAVIDEDVTSPAKPPAAESRCG